MKTFKTILLLIIIGMVSTFGIVACKSTPTELDENTLVLRDTFDSYTWEVTKLNKSLFDRGFSIADKMETTAFGNSIFANGLEEGQYYALKTENLSGTYWAYSKNKIFGKVLHSLKKSTTIDDETFNKQISFTNASWKKKELDKTPSLDGYIKLSSSGLSTVDSSEFNFIAHMSFIGERPDEPNKWYEITASEFPDLIFLRSSTAGNVSVISVYKKEL